MKLRDVFLAVVLLMIASIALYPSFVRARVSANNSQAIGDTRAIVSGLVTYASVNCGFYPSQLSCTTWEGDGDIAACIPNYPSSAPQFLGGELAGSKHRSQI
jgi:hypothetical protein